MLIDGNVLPYALATQTVICIQSQLDIAHMNPLDGSSATSMAVLINLDCSLCATEGFNHGLEDFIWNFISIPITCTVVHKARGCLELDAEAMGM